MQLSDYKKKQIFNCSRQLLEELHLKMPIYNFSITVAQEFALQKLREIVKNTTVSAKKSTGKKVVIHNVHGTYLEAIYKEGGLGKALQLRGNDVKMILCGGALDECTVLFTNKIPPNPWICRNCKYFSKNFFETIGISHATYSDYLDEKHVESIKEMVSNLSIDQCKKHSYKGVNVGFHTMTSVHRFYKGLDPSLSKFKYEDILRTRLVNAMISTDVAEKVAKVEKPDVLVASHSCYSEFGSFTEYFKNNNMKAYTWYTGYRPDQLIFDLDKVDKYFDRYYKEFRKKKPLTKKEEKELYDYINLRITGDYEGGDTYYYGFSKEKKDNLEDEFHFKKYKKTFGIFPNLPWDVDLTYTNTAFKDVYDWVSHTIKLFLDRPDNQLIIKIHPAEKLFQSENTVLDFIQQNYPNLPVNISLIPPDTDISPYFLFPYLDVGILYNGTLGLEMLLHDIPVVVAGRAHYSQKGFTYDVTTKKEYAKVLFSKNSAEIVKKNKNIVKIYAYYYFIKSFIPFDILRYKSFLDHGWRINSFDEIAEGNNKYIDHICNYIVNDGIFQTW